MNPRARTPHACDERDIFEDGTAVARLARPAPLVADSIARVFAQACALAARALGAIGRGRERKRAVDNLLALDDRLLRDIGIARSSIPYLRHGARSTELDR